MIGRARMIVLALDADVAGHLAVAIRRHREVLERLSRAEPPELADLEELVVSIAKRHQAPPSASRLDVGNDAAASVREYLTRHDVHELTGASLRTIDRWIASGQLRSTRAGRMRRIARQDLAAFLERDAA